MTTWRVQSGNTVATMTAWLQRKLYSCVEVGCPDAHSPTTLVPFLRHQRAQHGRGMVLHYESFDNTTDFVYWMTYAARFLYPLDRAESEEGAHFTCASSGSDTTCPVQVFVKKKHYRRLNILKHKVVFMGEHYGHCHKSTLEEQHFFLEYTHLSSAPIDTWMNIFTHCGVILTPRTTPALVQMAERCHKLDPLIVVGFMNKKQKDVLEEFHDYLFFEDHGDWILIHSLVVNENSSVEVPVASCYSNHMDDVVIVEFYMQLFTHCQPFKPKIILSNNCEKFEKLWQRASGHDTIFVMNFCEPVRLLKVLVPASDSPEVFRERYKLLEACILGNFQCIQVGIQVFMLEEFDLFEMDHVEAEEIHRFTDSCLFWYYSVINSGLSVHQVFLNSIEWYSLRNILLQGDLPKVFINLSLYSNFILDKFQKSKLMDIFEIYNNNHARS